MDDNRNGDRVSKAADEAKDRLAATTQTVSDLAGKAGTAAAGAASTIQGAARKPSSKPAMPQQKRINRAPRLPTI